MATTEKTLDDLFLDTLKDIYYAEKQITEGPAQDGEGRPIRRAQGRLETDATRPRARSTASTRCSNCPRQAGAGQYLGSRRHHRHHRRRHGDHGGVQDHLRARCRTALGRPGRRRRCEISRYGTLKAWDAKLNLPEAVRLLEQTLQEEEEDPPALLSVLAEKQPQPEGGLAGRN